MSRRDPGAANADTGQVAANPGRCLCQHLICLHEPTKTGRGACSASTCNCTHYEEA